MVKQLISYPSVCEYAYLPGSSKYIEIGRPVDSANTNKPWEMTKNRMSQSIQEILPFLVNPSSLSWLILLLFCLVISVFAHNLTRNSFRQKVTLLWVWTAKWSNSSEARHSSVSMALDWSEKQREKWEWIESKSRDRFYVIINFIFLYFIAVADLYHSV